MKKRYALFLWLFILGYFIGVPAASAAIISGEQLWSNAIDVDETITCIAYYMPDLPEYESAVFAAPSFWGVGVYSGTPDWTEDVTGYQDFGTIRDDWVQQLSLDGKTTYLWGTAFENGDTAKELFSYKLRYEWDDASTQPPFDPAVPVSQDSAVFDDYILGSASEDEWNWTGMPDDPGPGSWLYSATSEGGPYTNPIPEPMTLGLLGLGIILAKTGKRSKK